MSKGSQKGASSVPLTRLTKGNTSGKTDTQTAEASDELRRNMTTRLVDGGGKLFVRPWYVKLQRKGARSTGSDLSSQFAPMVVGGTPYGQQKENCLKPERRREEEGLCAYTEQTESLGIVGDEHVFFFFLLFLASNGLVVAQKISSCCLMVGRSSDVHVVRRPYPVHKSSVCALVDLLQRCQ